MEELGYGPNGGLVYCMEYVMLPSLLAVGLYCVLDT